MFKSISVSFTTVLSANNLTVYLPDLTTSIVTVKVLLVPAKAEGVLVYSVFNEISTSSTFLVNTIIWCNVKNVFLLAPTTETELTSLILSVTSNV